MIDEHPVLAVAHQRGLRYVSCTVFASYAMTMARPAQHITWPDQNRQTDFGGEACGPSGIRAVPFARLEFFSSRTRPKRRRSSQGQLDSGVVPMMGTPLRFQFHREVERSLSAELPR